MGIYDGRSDRRRLTGFLSDTKLTNDRTLKEGLTMKNKVFPISMTVLWGVVFGSAMHSLTMGICMGLMMGTAFGLFDSDQKDNQGKE